jgi:hypothetical protein
VPSPGTVKTRRTTPWRKTSSKNVAAAHTALGLITSPPTARRLTTSAQPEPPGGVVYPVTTDISITRCPTLVPMEDDASTPMAITSRASIPPGNSPWKIDRSSTTTSRLVVTISAKES